MKAAFLANGPGEVWGWCRPLIAEAVRRGWETDVHLLPCPYASGRESEALSRSCGRVFSHASALGAFKFFSKKLDYDVVLQLGGDLMFGRWLAWRQNCPLACYSYGRKKGMEHCEKVLTSRAGLLDFDGAIVVGDLVLDSLDEGVPGDWKAPPGERIAAFPGSRPNIRDGAFALLQGIRNRFAQRDASIEVRVLLSPFARESEAQKWSDAGFSVWQGTTPAGIKGADLVMTQPGTNTLELMYCEQPFIVTIPYSFLRLMPRSGIIGMIGRIPLFGGALREAVIRTRLPKYIGKTAWPNRLACLKNNSVLKAENGPNRLACLKNNSVLNAENGPNRPAADGPVPEVIGDYRPEEIADIAFEVLKDKEGLLAQKRRLHVLAAGVERGAPKRICDVLEGMTADA